MHQSIILQSQQRTFVSSEVVNFLQHYTHYGTILSTCNLVYSLYRGEPLKRKKRIDPAIIKARADRRKRKLEKQIRKLQKQSKQLKPISEMEVPSKLIDERE